MDLPRFLDETGGVLALVSLTATVVWGLIAAGHPVLTPRARLLAQAVHRATAVAALGFLLAHVAVKVAAAHAPALAALVPFASGARGPGVLLGLGSLAAYLMVTAVATGVLRGAFAGRGHTARRWRSLHACAYGAWCAAVLHGLNAGRPAAAWVTACYALSLSAVAAALLFRLLRARGALPALLRRRPAGAHAAGRAGKEPPARPLPSAPSAPTGGPADGRQIARAGSVPAPADSAPGRRT
ncbi:hypothetical protein [Streptomyces sp. NPDC053048]|uniref:hypothetical protein n=1 Tax=Streptomyces sp. NPDC053048 TaxID=3365694 RepID=UPI0037D80462